MENQTTEKATKYGEILAQGIRKYLMENTNYKPTNFERFVLDRSYLYETKEELENGYDRYWKAGHGILIDSDEFIAEAETAANPLSEEQKETAREVYNILAEYVKEEILAAFDVYEYARNHWCIGNPEAIKAYQVSKVNYVVNSCPTEISEAEAIIKINREWGFEASRIEAIGTPYYEATDWQFIRFDCRGISWLWAEGDLYKVYE